MTNLRLTLYVTILFSKEGTIYLTFEYKKGLVYLHYEHPVRILINDHSC